VFYIILNLFYFVLKKKEKKKEIFCSNFVSVPGPANFENLIDRIKNYIDRIKTQLREKPHRASQTQDIHYSEDKASTLIVTLTFPMQRSYLAL
jgi:hypothetical protein